MSKPMILILLGAPGAGKGTYCKPLMENYGTPQISTGDILRLAVKEGWPIGKVAKEYMDKGQLVPDEVVVGVVEDRIKAADCAKGFILDGFPRTVAQAEMLDKMLSKNGLELCVALNLDVPKEILMKRLTGRRMCRGCKQGNFNIYTLPPKKEGVCDYCGGELYQRDDDKEEVILNRLKVYEAQTAPLIEYYGKKGLLDTLKSTGEITAMTRELVGMIERRKKA